MSPSHAHDYHAALVEIEALWDFFQRPETAQRIKVLVQLAEDYEREAVQASDPLITTSFSPKVAEQTAVECVDALSEPLVLRAFIGWRSATAAIRACRLLMVGNAPATAIWMNRQFHWTEFTPLELAEQNVSGLQMVLDEIGRIDAGVFA